MNDHYILECIAVSPKVMTGNPVIRGKRLTVDYILNLLGHGATFKEILDGYNGLVGEDILACILFSCRR